MNFKIKGLFLTLSLLLFSYTLSIEAKSIVKIGKDMEVASKTFINNIILIGGDIDFNGTARGNIISVGGSVKLGPESRVYGKAVAIGGKVYKNPGAQLQDEIVEVDIKDITCTTTSLEKKGCGIGSLIFKIISFLAFAAIALFTIAFLPGHIDAISDIIEKKTLKSLMMALFGIALIIPVLIILVISIAGIVLIPLEFMFISIAFIAGYTACARSIGKRIIKALNKPDTTMFKETITGLIALLLTGFIPVIGPAVKIAAALTGFGAVNMLLLSNLKKHIIKK